MTTVALCCIVTSFCHSLVDSVIIMLALWNRADHYIFALWFLLSSFSLFNLSRRRLELDVCHTSPYFDTWCGLSANFRRRSEMCCTRLTGNAGRKKSRQKSPSGHHHTLCRAISSQLRHVSTIGKPPFPQIDIIGAVVIVWRVRGKLSGLFCAILCATLSLIHI